MAKLADEIHEMNNEQLEYALREAQESLFKLRVQSTTEKLETPTRLKRLRRTIARIKTIQHQRELGIES